MRLHVVELYVVFADVSMDDVYFVLEHASNCDRGCNSKMELDMSDKGFAFVRLVGIMRANGRTSE